MIYVCSLAALPRPSRDTGASHILTVMANVDQVQRPESVVAANHLKVSMDDITEVMDGFLRAVGPAYREGAEFRPRLGPRRADGGALLCGDKPFDRKRLCRGLHAQSTPRRDRDRPADPRRSPIASPNRLIVSLADKALGREGRMLRALDEMGPGSMTVEGRPLGRSGVDLDSKE